MRAQELDRVMRGARAAVVLLVGAALGGWLLYAVVIYPLVS